MLDADGAPAVGVVVASSAGGRALTGRDGRYRLAVQVPLEAESVEITALADDGGGSKVHASSRASGTSSVTTVDPLVIALGADCQPRWLSAFEGHPGVYGHVSGAHGAVQALTVFDDGSGQALYVGGGFESAGGVFVNNVARWNGKRWAALGGGANGSVNALAVFDDGSGPALYAGGNFTSAGGSAANHIAKWNGSKGGAGQRDERPVMPWRSSTTAAVRHLRGQQRGAAVPGAVERHELVARGRQHERLGLRLHCVRRRQRAGALRGGASTAGGAGEPDRERDSELEALGAGWTTRSRPGRVRRRQWAGALRRQAVRHRGGANAKRLALGWPSWATVGFSSARSVP